MCIFLTEFVFSPYLNKPGLSVERQEYRECAPPRPLFAERRLIVMSAVDGGPEGLIVSPGPEASRPRETSCKFAESCSRRYYFVANVFLYFV